MIKIIPEEKTTYCDVCGKQFDLSDTRQDITVSFEGEGLDYTGLPVGPAFPNKRFNLCSDCGWQIYSLVKE
jgi:hypothetical protein